MKTVKLSDGTVVWAEYAGTWVVNGYATGVSSIYATRAAADPAVAHQYGTSVSNGTKLYNGDVLKLTAVAKSGYTLSSTTKTVTVSTPSPTSSSSRESNCYTDSYDFGGRLNSQLTAPVLSTSYRTVRTVTWIDAKCTNSNSIDVIAHYGQSSSCSSTVSISAGASVTLYTASTRISSPTNVYVYCYFTDNDVGEYFDSSTSSMLYRSAGSSGDIGVLQ